MDQAALIAGSLGAFVGLAIALVANLVVLPAVLKAQEDGFIMGRKTVLSSMTPDTVARITRFMYRVPMPLLFAFVGFLAGLKAYGGY
ncbi:hypothetical protein SAMN04488056_104134 [Cohaesibacter marisflavi]|uniref:Uncharacterized protein n=1 Tax=Cohaesibacter marisflavi TaxID=655353 RepID=A0A1I5FNQ7_9HYPH|nr:hypothetical protein [Cohaesibacter marisflavi]SFO25400.1 hypothetical protein SAMN04488056_104134 [Cohaesibacter marisflavi]